MTSAKKKWLGAGLITACVATVAASHALTDYLVRIAVDRDCPAGMDTFAKKVIRGSSCSAAFLQTREEAAHRLAAMPHETVQLPAKDGAILIGHWFPSPNPKRIIVAMHGWRSGWNWDFGMIAPFLFENGCSVLFAEQRGQNDSGGDCMGLGALERYDCQYWAHWVDCHNNAELPIYLAGVSMGASTVLMASALPLPDRVRGLFADCGFTSPHAICKHVVEHNLHLNYSLRAPFANALCKKRNYEGLNSCSAIDSLKSCKIPVLFVHGADDCFVPVSMTYENYKACAGPKSLFIVPGADHGMSYYTDRAGYEKAVLNFWKQYD